MTVESHINAEYSRTRWPYFNFMEILNEFGEPGREELTRLREEGKIKGRKGCNSPIVQLLVTEKGEIVKEP